MIDYRTYFLFCQDEKTTFFELGEAPNGLRYWRWGGGRLRRPTGKMISAQMQKV
jgi:hypothetical protein